MIKEINDLSILNNYGNYKYSFNEFNHIVGLYDGNLIGVIDYSLIYDRVEINYFFVLEQYRCKGYGSKLLDYVCKLGYSVSLEVSEDNRSAIELYKKFGFKEVAIREKYYGSKNGILMVR